MDLKDIFGPLGNRGHEWTQGSGDNDGDWQDERPAYPKLRMPKIPKLWLTLAALFIVFTVVLPAFAVFMTNLYWFESHGYEAVFWRRLEAKCALFFAALIPAFLMYWLNWRFAWNSGIKHSRGTDDSAGTAFVGWALISFALFFAVINAIGSMGYWSTLLKFIYPSPFNETDPLFGHDIGFYVFTLPFIKFLRAWLQGLIAVSIIGSLAAYFLTHSVSFYGGRIDTAPKAKFHIALLGAFFLILWGAGYWLERYDLLLSPTGVVYGAGYTDIHIVMPALMILTAAAFAAAILLVVNIFKPMWKMSGILIGILIITGWVARSFIPGLVQQYRVKPNEYEMEKPYLAYHLDYTRRAFGLNNVRTLFVTPETEVTADELKADQETVSNIRLWDYSPLLRTYKQLQAIRTYYNFTDVYIDRYNINGKNRQVMLSVRELDLAQLQNPTWVNTHLEFTHGYGVVMNPVNEIAPGGLPVFFMKDLPPRSVVDIPLTRPEIYYGSKGDWYVLVKTDVKEFDYPLGDSNARTTYQGDGGVNIGSMWRRLLFALRFRDTEILFTGALKSDSRILFNRNVMESLAEVAPFLIFDGDTYPVIHDGRIQWMQDCFTWSQMYPYSKPVMTADNTLAHFNGVNYLRNSVKATVDAYDGKMVFYIVDDNDPLIKTWQKIFPSLFKGSSEMSPELWKHVRYPEDFFEVQADVYRTFHMTDTNTYYNREDVWAVTSSTQENNVRPNYVTMKLWGEKSPEFAIILPYMPLGRDNLIGWMAGRCDPKNYGELLVYKFPKQKLIYGPVQVEALINQNPEISAQISLWSQRGSDVIRGDLLVIPVGKSLLYVQPLYLKAEKGELPELKRLIVSTGGRVAWAESFGDALEALMGQNVMAKDETAAAGKGGDTAAADKTGSQVSRESGGTDIADLIKTAQRLYDSAQKAQREGDWARYGTDIKKLGDVIAELERRMK